MKRFIGGLIGCGYFGAIQMEAWTRMRDVEICAVCDPIPGRVEAFGRRAYRSAEEMLIREKLDFVDIATRPESHLELASLAAQHRVPIICQKPIAPSWAEAVAMVETCEAAGVRLMIHENWRWQPWYRETAAILASGRFGSPIAYAFRTRKNDGSGPNAYPQQPYFRSMPRLLIHETLVHHIDTARFLFGPIATVWARTRRVNPAIAGEDRALLTLAHASGVDGAIDGHRFADPDPDGPAMGEAVIDCESGVVRISARGEISLGAQIIWKSAPATGYKGDSVLNTQRHFIDCLDAGTPFETNGREYLETFATVEAAYRSAAASRMVALPEITIPRS